MTIYFVGLAGLAFGNSVDNVHVHTYVHVYMVHRISSKRENKPFWTIEMFCFYVFIAAVHCM
jgi:hypothetical protein